MVDATYAFAELRHQGPRGATLAGMTTRAHQPAGSR